MRCLTGDGERASPGRGRAAQSPGIAIAAYAHHHRAAFRRRAQSRPAYPHLRV